MSSLALGLVFLVIIVLGFKAGDWIQFRSVVHALGFPSAFGLSIAWLVGFTIGLARLWPVTNPVDLFLVVAAAQPLAGVTAQLSSVRTPRGQRSHWRGVARALQFLTGAALVGSGAADSIAWNGALPLAGWGLVCASVLTPVFSWRNASPEPTEARRRLERERAERSQEVDTIAAARYRSRQQLAIAAIAMVPLGMGSCVAGYASAQPLFTILGLLGFFLIALPPLVLPTILSCPNCKAHVWFGPVQCSWCGTRFR